MSKRIRKFLIYSFLIAVSILGISSYLINEPLNYNIESLSETREYVLNTRTKKIHSMDCDSVSRMSEKNKKQVINSLVNLKNANYIICERCNAGLKVRHNLFTNIVNKIEDLIFGDPKITLPTKEEYLSSIDKMGMWYVCHIPTYESVLDAENANPEALNNYYSISNKLFNVGDLTGYPCEYINDNSGVYDAAFDDCVRFMFSSLNCMNGKYINLLSRYSLTRWSSINSTKLAFNNSEIQYAMYKLGFEVYDVKPNFIDLNRDGYYEMEIHKIDDGFTMQHGDILARDGHIHFYLDTNENFGWGKVSSKYPQKSLTYKNYDGHIICNGESFTRVYRYVGYDN